MQTRELLRTLDSVPKFMREPKRPEEMPTDLTAFLTRLYASDTAATAVFQEALARHPLRNYIQCVHPPDPDRRNGLDLLSAGARDEAHFPTYAENVQELDWN